MRDQVDAQVWVGKGRVLGRGFRLPQGFGPGGAEFRLAPGLKQGEAPDDPNGEQREGIGALRRLAVEMPRIGRPAADVEQRPMQVIRQRIVGNAERVDRLRNGVQRLRRGGRDRPPEAGHAHDLGIEILRRRRAPGRIEIEPARRQFPHRLTPVEIGGAEFRDFIPHESGARRAPVAPGEAVENVRDHGDARLRHRRPLRAERPLQPFGIERRGGGFERLREVVGLDLAPFDGGEIEGARRQHAHAQHMIQRRRRRLEAPVGEAEERIDRDETFERPQRRDAPAGLASGLGDPGAPGCRGFGGGDFEVLGDFEILGHGASPCDVGA